VFIHEVSIMLRWHWLVVGLMTLTPTLGCGRQGAVPAKPQSEDESKTGTDKSAPGEQSHTVRKPPPDREPEKPNPAVSATKEGDILRGRVYWQGKGPMLPGTDAKSRGIADVVVWLKNAPGGDTEDAPEDRVLSQRDGDFHPHLLLARKGDRLQLVSADDQANFSATGKLSFNLSLAPGKREFRALREAGLITVRSEVQVRASAYVWVFDHKYYTRTGADGRFRLPAVPPGTYRLMAWHEGSRPEAALQRQAILTVGKNQGLKVEWGWAEK
jgi:hypothetical protein